MIGGQGAVERFLADDTATLLAPRRQLDALGRELPSDWLKGCAQCREARLILDRRS